MAQDEAKKEQKNKNFTTKKKKETIQAIKLYNQSTTTQDFDPTWLPYDTRDPRLFWECDRGSEQEHVCACVWSGTVSSCSRTVHLLDAVRPGQRERGTERRHRNAEPMAAHAQCSVTTLSCLCHFASPYKLKAWL